MAQTWINTALWSMPITLVNCLDFAYFNGHGRRHSHGIWQTYPEFRFFVKYGDLGRGTKMV